MKTLFLTAIAAVALGVTAADAQQYRGPVYNDVYGTVPTTHPTPSPYGPGYYYRYRYPGYYAYGYWPRYRSSRYYYRY
jgi:hypothetical protein